MFYNNPLRLLGGGKEDRTPDPLLAKQGLSQLSYTPDKVVGLGRLELPTSRLSGVRSNHLSYKPMLVSASGRRFRLPTPCGGDEEDRTPDPLLARQVLSQLSYTPK